VPSAVTELDAVDLSQEETAPFTVGRQARGALAGELVGQHRLLPVRVAENVRAKLAIEALVKAGDLLSADDGIAEQLIDGAGHDRRSLRSAAINIGAQGRAVAEIDTKRQLTPQQELAPTVPPAFSPRRYSTRPNRLQRSSVRPPAIMSS
jgi:hypothetical protein